MITDLAAKAVSVLLDSDAEDEVLLHDVVRGSLNPGHEFVSAMHQGMGIVRYFHASDPWAFDLMIRIAEEEFGWSKLRHITVKWGRPAHNSWRAASPFAPDRDAGGGFASYDVKDADLIGRKLAALIKASKVHYASSDRMHQTYSDLWAMHWTPRQKVRRRR